MSLVAVTCPAAESASSPLTPQKVFGGLDHPCGIAVQPDTGTIFVAESGAGQIVRIVDGARQPVVTGIERAAYSGLGETFSAGPLGLLFLNRRLLIAGGAGAADHRDRLAVYVIPISDAQTLTEGQATFLGPVTTDDSADPLGDFFNLAAGELAVFATCRTDKDAGWLVKAEYQSEQFAKLEPYMPTAAELGPGPPSAITVGPHGDLVLAQLGSRHGVDSSITFVDPSSGKTRLRLPTGLKDITGLAYSPRGNLFALHFAPITAQGGLYRLDASYREKKQSVQPTQIAPLERPTAMAFGKQGELYITTLKGETPDGAAGEVWMIPAGL